MDQNNTSPSGHSVRQVLPDGLSIQVSQTWKTYAWNHATTLGEGDPTLNGLLPNNQKKAETLPPLSHPKMKGIGDPTPEEAKAISQNYTGLPAMLQQAGFKVMDDKREAFIQVATQAKRQLVQAYKGAAIPSAEMQRYDQMVNKYSFTGVEVIIRGFVVTKDNPKGSRQRKSDGKYVTERVLRRVTIDRPLSDSDLQTILDLVTGPLVKSMTRAAEYTATYAGRDKGGNPVIAVTLLDVNGKPVGNNRQARASSQGSNSAPRYSGGTGTTNSNTSKVETMTSIK